MRQLWTQGFLPVDKPVSPDERFVFTSLCRRHYNISRRTQNATIFLIEKMLEEAIGYAG